MAETNSNPQPQSHRKELIGMVVSTKMQKTIVVQVERQKAHNLYGRVISRRRKFYAHDEEQTAHVGDYVRIEETRPLSKLKRWKLTEVLRREKLAPEVQEAAS